MCAVRLENRNGYHVRTKWNQSSQLDVVTLSLSQDFDEFFGVEAEDAASKKEEPLKPAVEVYRRIKGLHFIFNEKEDAGRFDVLCKYILNR